MSVVVIGTGLAGTVAALAARAAGADVVVIGGRPGASAMWSGVAEAFGPIYDEVAHQDPLGAPHLVAAGRPPLEDRQSRLDRLLRRRSFHPYARLALDLAALSQRCDEALAVLGSALQWAETPTYVANRHGLTRLADGAAPSIWRGRLRAEGRYCVIGLSHYPAFDAQAVADVLADQGVRATSRQLDVPNLPLSQSPAAAAAALESRSDDELTALGAALRSATDGAVALLPPVLGRSAASNARLLGGLTDGAGATVAEVASTAQSLHGVRLHQVLMDKLVAADLGPRPIRVASAATEGRRIGALIADSGERIEVDGVILATGRAIGGGLRRALPFQEAIFGLPLFLEGAPLPPDQHPPELASRRFLDSQPLFTTGIGVSSQLQPLNAAAEPAWDNLWAAGLVLGGTDFVRDGSAYGVALVTGLLAGRHAARAEA